MIAMIWLLSLSLSAQTKTDWHFPVTIKVLRDVPVQPYPKDTREERGVLYIGRTAKGFVIKKGHTFLMTRILLEGGCDIRFEKRDYDFPSCPWLDGFRDQQADIFRVLPSK